MVNLLAFVPVVAIIAVIALIAVVFKSCYKKAPPNKAMVW